MFAAKRDNKEAGGCQRSRQAAEPRRDGAIRLAALLRAPTTRDDEGRRDEPLLHLQWEAAAGFGPVAGLVFDMGDVLFDATVWRRWLLQLLGRMGLQTHYRSFYRVLDSDYLGNVYRGDTTFEQAFSAYLLTLGLTSGQIDEIKAASGARKRLSEEQARALPGVRSTLDQLKQRGIRLGVLADAEWPAATLGQRLARMGLGGLFDAIVSSRDLGHTKPAAICYRQVLEQLGCRPSQTAFVGHVAADLAGAHRAGMRTLAFNFDDDACADLYLGRFDEILQVVADRTEVGLGVRGAA